MTSLALQMADFSNDTILTMVVKAVFIFAFLVVNVLLAIWAERRIVGRMQNRPGPNRHGPFGLLQSLADGVKLALKEDIIPTKADKVVYLLAPAIAVIPAFLSYAVIPFGPMIRVPGTNFETPMQLTDFPVAVLYILAVTSIGVYGLVLAGWASGSTYPLLGGIRSTAQLISYELAMGLSLVGVFIMAGSMSTSEIVNAQEKWWWAFFLLPSFVIYVIAMVGETNRLPFDLPEAEGELVGGFHTEYSSLKFALFFLAEYVNMFTVSGLATTLFLGGWRAPFGLEAINNGMLNTGAWPLLWFTLKVWMFIFLFIWLRGSLPRFRYDQFMKLGWKFLIPISLGWIFMLAMVQGLQQFQILNRNQMMIGFVIAMAVILGLFFFSGRKAEEVEEPATEFDAFAGGHPVPPLPGQTLAKSPRRRKAEAKAPIAAAEEK